MNEEVKEKLKQYKELTKQALDKVSILAEEGNKEHKIATDFLEMAKNYYKDVTYFEEKGDFLTALAACSYAHAWLDAGVKAGVFDAQQDDQLFTLP